MKYGRFGNTGMHVSRLCLGGMTFGGALDKQAVARCIDEAIDAGVNFIDTADSYGNSEEVIGGLLTSDKRERLFLATKVYKRFCRDGRVARNCRTNVISSLEHSLRLMRTDYVDLFQLHHPDPDAPIEETLATLDNLVAQGKIRYIGVSNHYAWQMAHMLGVAQAHHWEPMVSIQANYSILDRQIESETIPFIQKFNIALMCYSPLSGGVLTGKYANGLPEGSRATVMNYVKAYIEDPEVQEIVCQLAALAKDTGFAMNQLAILWLLAKPYTSTVILGGTRPEHFSEIYRVADHDLAPETIALIDEISGCRVSTRYVNQPHRLAPALDPTR